MLPYFCLTCLVFNELSGTLVDFFDFSEQTHFNPRYSLLIQNWRFLINLLHSLLLEGVGLVIGPSRLESWASLELVALGSSQRGVEEWWLEVLILVYWAEVKGGLVIWLFEDHLAACWLKAWLIGFSLVLYRLELIIVVLLLQLVQLPLLLSGVKHDFSGVLSHLLKRILEHSRLSVRFWPQLREIIIQLCMNSRHQQLVLSLLNWHLYYCGS